MTKKPKRFNGTTARENIKNPPLLIFRNFKLLIHVETSV